jgi:hypothetical protein
MKKFFYLIFILIISGLTSGCASIVSKSVYPITINSTPKGALIVITDKADKVVYQGNTPAMVKLKSGAGFFVKASYQVKLSLEGYEDRIVPINCKLDGWYIGNIVFGGIIGFLVIDPATGAMWKIDNKEINETLTKKAGTSQAPSLEIKTIHEIPLEWRAYLVRIN